MVMRLATPLLLALCAAASPAAAAGPSSAATGNVAGHDPFDELEAFYKAYRTAFDAADVEAVDKMFEYPYLLTNAQGSRQVENSDYYRSLLEQLKRAGWAGSRIANWQKIRMGKDGAIIIVDYMRLRADGSELNGNRAAYLLRHRPTAGSSSESSTGSANEAARGSRR